MRWLLYRQRIYKRNMAKIDKAGIYIDVQHLMRIVYKAQFEMDKKDRCVIYPTMMQLILDMLSHFCLSFCTENKLEHLDIMIAKFQAFKPMLRFCIEEKMFKKELTINSLRERVVKIEEGIAKWRKYLKESRQDQGLNGQGRTL